MIYSNRTFQPKKYDVSSLSFPLTASFRCSLSLTLSIPLDHFHSTKQEFISHFSLRYQFSLRFSSVESLEWNSVFSVLNRCVVTVVTTICSSFLHEFYTFLFHVYTQNFGDGQNCLSHCHRIALHFWLPESCPAHNFNYSHSFPPIRYNSNAMQ